MIKRTLYFGNPAYLSLKNSQLIIKLPEVEKNISLPQHFKANAIKTIPVEDIGVLILDHNQITITHALMIKLMENNCALISCNSKRMPYSLTLPLVGNSTQTERYRFQIQASLPLQKQLWQQTVIAKIENQAHLLSIYSKAVIKNMLKWQSEVKSGDADNHEARAAVYYWSNLFPTLPNFIRQREGSPPNNLLNYGYAILRAVVARSLVASGLLPSLGIFHQNKYNAYCLADDIMEPYRPFVDKLVCDIVDQSSNISTLTKEHKARLLNIPILDVKINGRRSPLMVAMQQTAASLSQCYMGEIRKIKYPSFT